MQATGKPSRTRWCLGAAATQLLVACAGQPQTPRDAHVLLTGRWVMTSIATTTSNDWSLRVLSIDGDGRFVGTMDFSSRKDCFTRGKSVSGTWVDGVLSFKVEPSRKCSEWTITLKEGGGEHLLSGRIEGMGVEPPPTAWLDKKEDLPVGAR